MKIYNSDQIREIEQAALERGISLDTLMENAGASLAKYASEEVHLNRSVTILCGCGNNGGDGFVCAARLHSFGFYVTVILASGEPKTELAKKNFDKLPKDINVIDANQNKDDALIEIAHSELLIDAIFGFGFKGALRGTELELVQNANKLSSCIRISADIPSGVECDTALVQSDAFRADKTISFTAAKPAHALYPGKAYSGEVVLADIGIPETIAANVKSDMMLTDLQNVKSYLPIIGRTSNKGSNGRLFMVCGSHSMAGACIMAARAALRTGIGLLDIGVDEKIYPIVAAAVPEAIFTIYNVNGTQKLIEKSIGGSLEKATAVLIGPGLGDCSEKLCSAVFKSNKLPAVIDADALNYLARDEKSLQKLDFPRIFTPHPGEMARLINKTVDEIQKNRIATAKSFAFKSGGVSVLKGASTIIASPDGRVAVNPTGNEGLAKGGSGDVLSGIMGALLAQGMDTFECAATAAFIHGTAADICAARGAKRSVLPTDLPETLPEVFKFIEELE